MAYLVALVCRHVENHLDKYCNLEVACGLSTFISGEEMRICYHARNSGLSYFQSQEVAM